MRPLVQGGLIHNREDDLFDRAIGVVEGRFSQAKQHPGLAIDPFEILQKLSLDLPFGSGADAMNQLNERVD